MNRHKASRQQEQRTAAVYGGSVNAGSGNQPFRKNDVRTATKSIECKTTSKRSYTLKLDELLAAETHALLDGRAMLFEIEMGGRTWVVMAREDYLADLEAVA
ncbi:MULTISPECIES: hypothetical protein [Nonomuraea]|uniref:hypothetical protein n=1 Tax=Nonomuraea TaxID=83681 RepID=UPI0012F880B6|nr:hypothetical protein [Nonomuraea typhae]